MGTLICITGPAGSGKTTFSQILAELLRCTYLDYDTLSMDFIEKISHDTQSSIEAINKEYRDLRYKILWNVAMENLYYGSSVIVCAPFSWEVTQRDFFKNLKSEQKVNFTIVDCRIYLDQATLKQRLIKRNMARDREKINNIDYFTCMAAEREYRWKSDQSFYINNNNNVKELKLQAFSIKEQLQNSGMI